MKKVLVVEDDPAIQRALKRLFEAEDFAVEITSDGKSALEALDPENPLYFLTVHGAGYKFVA